MIIGIYDLLILAGVPSIITILFQTLLNKRSEKKKKTRDNEVLINKALQALLRDKLRDHYVKYINQGWVDIDDKSNFSNMYDIYHSLGKNGVIDGMCKQVMELPTMPSTIDKE